MCNHVVLHHAHQVLLADVKSSYSGVVTHASRRYHEAFRCVVNESNEGAFHFELRAASIGYQDAIMGYMDCVRAAARTRKC